MYASPFRPLGTQVQGATPIASSTIFYLARVHCCALKGYECFLGCDRECRVELPGLGSLAGPGKTRVVPLPPGEMLPRLPPLGMRSPDEPALFPGSSFIEHSKLEMGRDQRRQTGVNPAGASTQDGHATVPNSAPTPAVTAIARAPQNVTRKHEHSHRTLRESQKSNNPSVSAGLPSRPPRPSNPNPSHPQPSVRSEVVKEFARHAKPLVPALE
jgi:hypothetical protein